MTLSWPRESSAPLAASASFVHAASNICLDLHGDPARAGVVVFSDGNHHMALGDALARFDERHPDAGGVFYVTTPPRVIVEALDSGSISIGNLTVSTRPHVFISPASVLEGLRAKGAVPSHSPLASSRGSVLLVRKGNPRRITGAADLARADVRLFLSNPRTEKVSYDIYAGTLRRIAARERLDLAFLEATPEDSRVVYGALVHHREAPQAVADDRADAAVVFHHLALRYARIFPDLFESVPLTSEGSPDQVTSTTHAGLVGDGGVWGGRALEHLLSPEVAAIYRHHGLDPAQG